VAVVAGSEIARRRSPMPLRNTARFALAFSAGALFFKLLVVMHPSAGGVLPAAGPVLGALSSVHVAGVAAQTLVLCLDAVAALLLYPVVARIWADRTAAAIAIAVYHLIPAGFVAVADALPDALARTAAIAAIPLLLTLPRTSRFTLTTVGLGLVLAVGFAASAAMFSVLAGSFLLIGLLPLLTGREGRRMAGAILLATVLAGIVAAAAHAMAPPAEPHAMLPSAAWADTAPPTPPTGAAATPWGVVRLIGAPLLLLAGFGAARLYRAGARDMLTLTAAGLVAAPVAFLAAGMIAGQVWAPALAASPGLAMLGGLGAAELWRGRGHWRGAGVILLAWAVRIGTQSWWRAL
jgi:hypothetical protein